MATEDKGSETRFQLFSLRDVLSAGFLSGAKDRIAQIISDSAAFISSTQMASGDQRIAHAPHPVDALRKNIADKFDSFVHPAGDMNLAHAPHPVEDMHKVISAKISELQNNDATTNARNVSHAVGTASVDFALLYAMARPYGLAADAKFVDNASITQASENVSSASQKLELQASQHLSAETESAIKDHATVKSAPSLDWNVYSEMLGSGVAGKPANASYSGIRWSEYANILGEGVFRPDPRLKRDFSDLMQCNPGYKTNSACLTYYMDEERKVGLNTYVKDGRMRFTIQAQGNCEKFGYGDEILMSCFKKLHEHGVNITAIEASWDGGYPYTTNARQYRAGIDAGLSMEAAAANTFTGKSAADLGLTKVVINPEKPLRPEFEHPDWGAGEQMNHYSLAFARAHGRAGMDVLTRPNALGNPPSEIAQELVNYCYGLPECQRWIVLEKMRNNLATEHENLLHKAYESLLKSPER